MISQWCAVHVNTNLPCTSLLKHDVIVNYNNIDVTELMLKYSIGKVCHFLTYEIKSINSIFTVCIEGTVQV